MQRRMNTQIHTYVCMYTCTHLSMYVCIYIHMTKFIVRHAFMYTDIKINIDNLNIHIYTYILYVDVGN